MSDTTRILMEASQLMEDGHRARYRVYDSHSEKFCPLGAIAKARGFQPSEDWGTFSSRAYDETKAVELVALAILDLNPVEAADRSYAVHPSFLYTTLVHGWNDETENDEKVLEVMRHAVDLSITSELAAAPFDYVDA